MSEQTEDVGYESDKHNIRVKKALLSAGVFLSLLDTV
jgi:hypothetical protein